jgi:hypothetical protein
MVTWNDGGDVVVTGSDALTKPGGSQFSVSGGNGPYTWSVSGTGVTVTQEGYLELTGSACGVYTITCTDCTGRSSSVTGRVTNNGSWTQTETYSFSIELGSCDTSPYYCGGWRYGGWGQYYSGTQYSGHYKRNWSYYDGVQYNSLSDVNNCTDKLLGCCVGPSYSAISAAAGVTAHIRSGHPYNCGLFGWCADIDNVPYSMTVYEWTC